MGKPFEVGSGGVYTVALIDPNPTVDLSDVSSPLIHKHALLVVVFLLISFLLLMMLLSVCVCERERESVCVCVCLCVCVCVCACTHVCLYVPL